MDGDIEVLRHVYDRFNARDIDGVLMALADNVAWANGMDGGHIHGREAVRAYSTRQWAMVDPHVAPLSFRETADGAIVAKVRQSVRDLDGKPLQGQTHGLSDKMVGHVFRLHDGKVVRFDIQEIAQPACCAATPFRMTAIRRYRPARAPVHGRPVNVSSRETDMHMNHLNLCVSDVPGSRAFFERYFGYKLLVEKGADTFVGLVDDGGMVLAISNFNRADSVRYPPLFHVGFLVDTDEEVNAIHERLAADGFEPGKPKHFHGAWTFYVAAPGGGTVEVAHQGPGFD